MSFAKHTTVDAVQTEMEIRKLLQRAGADSFIFAQVLNRVQIGFRIAGRAVRIELPMPDPEDPKFKRTPERGWQRSPEQAAEAYHQEWRRRWRSLALVLKAKLVAVEDGISTIEREFLADIVMPNGRTLMESIGPALDASRNGSLLQLPEALTHGK